MKVVFCLPFLDKPMRPMLDSLEAAVPMLEKFGFEHQLVQHRGNPYISSARATMLRQALDQLDPEKDAVAFLDYDVSARPMDYVKLLATEGEVVAGTYRFKDDAEDYMGAWNVDQAGRPIVRPQDGAIDATMVPAGFLKVRITAIDKLMLAYPELCFGPPSHPSFDLFNHGAHQRLWWGEDYAFCRRWGAIGGKIWLVPDLKLDHWGFDLDGKPKAYKGHLHGYLQRQPGGSLDPDRPTAAALADLERQRLASL